MLFRNVNIAIHQSPRRAAQNRLPVFKATSRPLKFSPNWNDSSGMPQANFLGSKGGLVYYLVDDGTLDLSRARRTDSPGSCICLMQRAHRHDPSDEINLADS